MPALTKLELQQQLAHVNQLYAQARERISALEMDLEIARKAMPSAIKPEPAAFGTYPEYVAACRAFARATRQRIVSYVSREQWAHRANQAMEAICN